jgi:hypothetical protein
LSRNILPPLKQINWLDLLPRIVDNNVNATKGINCSLDNAITKFNRVVVGSSLATSGFDFIDNLVGCGAGLALSGDGSTEVIDNNRTATGGKEQSICPSQTLSIDN